MNINISEMVRHSIAQALRDAADQLEQGGQLPSVMPTNGLPAVPGPNRIGGKVRPGTAQHHVLSLPSGSQFRPSDVTKVTGRSVANVNTTLNRMRSAGHVRNVKHGIWERI